MSETQNHVEISKVRRAALAASTIVFLFLALEEACNVSGTDVNNSSNANIGVEKQGTEINFKVGVESKDSSWETPVSVQENKAYLPNINNSAETGTGRHKIYLPYIESPIVGIPQFNIERGTGFTDEMTRKLEASIQKISKVYLERFGPSSSPYITAVIPKPDKEMPLWDSTFSAYYFGPNQTQEYPEGVIVLDADKLTEDEKNRRFLYTVGCEVAHAWQIDYLPLEKLGTLSGRPGTDGVEFDEYVMAETASGVLGEIYLNDDVQGSPLLSILDQYPNFYKEMRIKWQENHKPEFIPEEQWLYWADEIWPDFSSWWQQTKS